MDYLGGEGGPELAQGPELVVGLLDLLFQVALLHLQLLLGHVGVAQGLVQVVQALALVVQVALQALVLLVQGRLKTKNVQPVF